MQEKKTPLLLRPFKWLWYLAVGIYRTIFVLLLVALIVAFFAAQKERPLAQIKSGVALVIAPSGELVDQMEGDGVSRFLEQVSEQPPPKTLVRDVTDALEAAADDNRIP